MECDIVDRELRHELEINLAEPDSELGLEFRPDIFVDEDWLTLAEKSPEYLVMSKAWLFEPGNGMLEETVDYIRRGVMRAVHPMDYFYDERRLDTILEMVPRVAVSVMLQEFAEVDREDDAQIAACTDCEAVMRVLGCYAYFLCLENRHFGPSRYDELFTRLWWAYFDGFENEMCNFWEDGESWRSTWKGCLFFRG